MPGEFIEVKHLEAATDGLLPPSRFYKLREGGVFPPGLVVQLGRRLFINRERLEKWIETGGGGFEGGWRKATPGHDGGTNAAAIDQG